VLLGWPASPSMIRWRASDWPFKLPNDIRGQCEAAEGGWEEVYGRGGGGDGPLVLPLEREPEPVQLGFEFLVLLGESVALLPDASGRGGHKSIRVSQRPLRQAR